MPSSSFLDCSSTQSCSAELNSRFSCVIYTCRNLMNSGRRWVDCKSAEFLTWLTPENDEIWQLLFCSAFNNGVHLSAEVNITNQYNMGLCMEVVLVACAVLMARRGRSVCCPVRGWSCRGWRRRCGVGSRCRGWRSQKCHRTRIWRRWQVYCHPRCRWRCWCCGRWRAGPVGRCPVDAILVSWHYDVGYLPMRARRWQW